jgi:hypothetical protein
MPAAKTPVSPDILRRETITAGERLNFALGLEQQLHEQLLKQPDRTVLAQWKQCRRSVESFAADYVSALRAYRSCVTPGEGDS